MTIELFLAILVGSCIGSYLGWFIFENWLDKKR